MADVVERTHHFHAEASVLSGALQLPVKQDIQLQAFAKLPETGGYLAQQAGPYRLENVLSFKSAKTQVAGNREVKPGHGWSTLVTSVVEGLNVLDVITADRVVGQISTEHPLVGHIPKVTFLGTRFENLRINGHLVKLDLDLELFGEKPQGEVSHMQNPAFMAKLSKQHVLLQADPASTAEEAARYNRQQTGLGDAEKVECSLVNHVEGGHPGRSFGHVVRIPDFGVVTLAHLQLIESDFQDGVPHKTIFDLTMVDIQMGCIATGTASVAKMIANGKTRP